jgi:hypothetical protein
MRLRRKIAPFIFGVTIGLLIGIGFFMFKVNDWFNKIKDSASQRITVIEQPVKTVVAEPVKKKEEKDRFKINTAKSTKVNYREVDSIIKTDAGIKIATDELLTVKNIKIIRIDDNVAEADTSAAALAHVEEKSSDLFVIEFWRTPLNSKGYRFMKNKIMLYGFMDFNMQLYQFDDDYYLKSADQVYRLFHGSEFRKPDRVVDPDLLAKIN